MDSIHDKECLCRVCIEEYNKNSENISLALDMVFAPKKIRKNWLSRIAKKDYPKCKHKKVIYNIPYKMHVCAKCFMPRNIR